MTSESYFWYVFWYIPCINDLFEGGLWRKNYLETCFISINFNRKKLCVMTSESYFLYVFYIPCINDLFEGRLWRKKLLRNLFYFNQLQP